MPTRRRASRPTPIPDECRWSTRLISAAPWSPQDTSGRSTRWAAIVVSKARPATATNSSRHRSPEAQRFRSAAARAARRRAGRERLATRASARRPRKTKPSPGTRPRRSAAAVAIAHPAACRRRAQAVRLVRTVGWDEQAGTCVGLRSLVPWFGNRGMWRGPFRLASPTLGLARRRPTLLEHVGWVEIAQVQEWGSRAESLRGTSPACCTTHQAIVDPRGQGLAPPNLRVGEQSRLASGGCAVRTQRQYRRWGDAWRSAGCGGQGWVGSGGGRRGVGAVGQPRRIIGNIGRSSARRTTGFSDTFARRPKAGKARQMLRIMRAPRPSAPCRRWPSSLSGRCPERPENNPQFRRRAQPERAGGGWRNRPKKSPDHACGG